MIREALAKCDRQITLSSVRGAKYELGRDSRYYSSCLVDPFMLEYHGGPRPPRLKDCVDNARLVDALDLIGMPYKMDLAYADVPEDHGVLWSNYALMSQMSKHYIFGPHNVAEARTWMEMCEIMAAGPLGEDRIASALVSPISPLRLDKDYLELVEYLAPLGIVLILLPCPMSGVTSPFSLAGTVVTYNAENLAAIVTIQTLQPGAALVYHNVASAFNMRSARSSLGGPEKILFGSGGGRHGPLLRSALRNGRQFHRFAPLRRAKWRRIHGPTPAGRLGPGQHGHRHRLAGRRQRHLCGTDSVRLRPDRAGRLSRQRIRRRRRPTGLCGVGTRRAGGQFFDRRAYHDALCRRRALPRRQLRSQRHV